MKVPLARTTLVNEPDKYSETIAVVYELTKKNSGDAVRRLGIIIKSIFCAQSGASIRLTVWKWSSESRYPGTLQLCLKTFVAQGPKAFIPNYKASVRARRSTTGTIISPHQIQGESYEKHNLPLKILTLIFHRC